MNTTDFDLEAVLDDVRRTAKDGVPMGKGRFCRETGHNEYEWQKLGMRWNDVVRQAGLVPNHIAEKKFNPKILVPRMAELTRKIGKVPARVDLFRARRDDPTFPCTMTFETMGRKRQLVNAVMEYCRKRRGWADVTEICEKYLTLRDNRQWWLVGQGKGQLISEDKPGFVYLVKSGRYCKIGKCKSLRRRTGQVRLALPEKVRLVHAIRTTDPAGIEKYWHQHFEDKRVNGEWFKLSRADVAEFKLRKFM